MPGGACKLVNTPMQLPPGIIYLSNFDEFHWVRKYLLQKFVKEGRFLHIHVGSYMCGFRRLTSLSAPCSILHVTAKMGKLAMEGSKI